MELLGQKVGTKFEASETYYQTAFQKGKMQPHQHCSNKRPHVIIFYHLIISWAKACYLIVLIWIFSFTSEVKYFSIWLLLTGISSWVD